MMTHVCLLVFFVFLFLLLFFLIKVLLHQDPHLQSDIAIFFASIPIPQNKKVFQVYRECLKMGTRSTDVYLGSTEQAEVHTEIYIGAKPM